MVARIVSTYAAGAYNVERIPPRTPRRRHAFGRQALACIGVIIVKFWFGHCELGWGVRTLKGSMAFRGPPEQHVETAYQGQAERLIRKQKTSSARIGRELQLKRNRRVAIRGRNRLGGKGKVRKDQEGNFSMGARP